MQNESKRRVIFDLFVAHLDGAAFLDGVAADDRIQHGVDELVDVLNQHSLSHGHGSLDHVQVVLETETHDRQSTGVPILRTVQLITMNTALKLTTSFINIIIIASVSVQCTA